MQRNFSNIALSYGITDKKFMKSRSLAKNNKIFEQKLRSAFGGDSITGLSPPLLNNDSGAKPPGIRRKAGHGDP